MPHRSRNERRRRDQGPDGKTQVVATGPFVVSEWAAGDHLLLSRNPNYWRAGVPYLEAIRYSILLDTQAMMVQFESHALDAVWLPPARDAVRLANDPAYQTVALAGGGNGQALFLNAALPPYTNKNVRQAINYAVNRERYRTVAYSGLGDVEVLPWPPISAAFERARNATYAFDLDKAASLLRDSGEHVTDLELVYTTSPEFDALGQLLQSDLKTLGVNVTLTPVGAAAFNAQIQDLKQTGGILGFGYTRWNPTSFLNLSATFKPQGSITRYSSDHYSQLIDAGSKEPDDARRQALYSQINDMILDESFGIPVLVPPQFLLATTSVQNIQLSAQRGYPVYSDIWLA
ncbi:MAG: ABC transporter substrate-binding protein [Chloroflexi bacterium]|nr:ABC transporter substrate-binding protein [Chloroflexota bacterium]